MTGDDVVAAARECLGTPFCHQGRIPGLALDCAGLIVAVAQKLGIYHFDVDGYGRRPNRGLLESTLASQPELIAVDCARLVPGDILLMRFTKDPQHLAIFAGETIIHSWSSPGKVCEHRIDAVWRSRIIAAYRFREVQA